MDQQVQTLRVLIVDDSFEDREILKRYLKKVSEYHFQLTEAKDVEEAIGHINHLPPDLMFVDFNMPGATGIDLLEKLRKFNNYDFPIIMLTGEGSESVAVSAMKIGVGDYLIKDEINPNSVRIAIIATLDRFNMEKTIEAQRHQLEIAARTDGLTGLWNRRYFDEQLELEMERALRYKLVLSLVMADLDHFKKVNDNFGHLIGDSVLIGFAEVLREQLRMSDFAARYGGEEFCVIMPNINLENSILAIQRLQKQLKIKKYRNDKGDPFRITASFGTVVYSNLYPKPEHFLEAVDKALYHAKETGRDRIIAMNHEGVLEPVPR